MDKKSLITEDFKNLSFVTDRGRPKTQPGCDQHFHS